MMQTFVSGGVSGAARYIETETRENRRYLHESPAFGIESVLRNELAEVWRECQQANWDGYDALPVSRDVLSYMYQFLEALPFGFPPPSINADPQGCLSVEWYRNPRRVLSVAVSDDGSLHYAALLGANKACGTETFDGDIPKNILNLVQRVYS